MNKEFKVFKPGEFTVMPNYHLMDETLSLKAIGLLSKMLNLPENWDYSLKGLVAISKESYDTIRGILNELKDHNYIEIIKTRHENGTFKYNYLIFMNPSQKAEIMRNYPDGKNPYVDEPDMENYDKYNINKYIEKKFIKLCYTIFGDYMKKIFYFICIVLVLFITLLIVEYARFSFFKKEIPLFVVDKKFCSKDSFACYDKNGIYTEKYYGIGFSTELQYVLIDQENNESDYNYCLKERHFVLFYIIKL